MKSGKGHTVTDETYHYLTYEDGYIEKDEENLRLLAEDWCQYDQHGCDKYRYSYGFEVVLNPPVSWLQEELIKEQKNLTHQENLIKQELGMVIKELANK